MSKFTGSPNSIANFRQRTPVYIQLKDPEIDCPNKSCDGWLCMFGKCALVTEQPSEIVAMCLRCHQQILQDGTDAIPTSCGTVDGFVHAHCNKRGRTQEVDSLPNSQDDV
eukprot:gene37735-46562_t